MKEAQKPSKSRNLRASLLEKAPWIRFFTFFSYVLVIWRYNQILYNHYLLGNVYLVRVSFTYDLMRHAYLSFNWKVNGHV